MNNFDFLKNKVILVTGGSGSIGGLLVSRLLETKCKSIRVLSNSEHELYLIKQKYENNSRLRFLLGDVRDKERLLTAATGVDIVFHAAALKHVPLCEYNPYDAIQTNVIGTKNVIDASMKTNVKKFVLISTDKAANPHSTLGATKLLAERLTIAAKSYEGSESKLIMYCVRFGNVLGSRGSVFEKFMEQIKKEESLTVTDKKMTRFAMTPNDAVDLVLATVPLAKGGEIFVLKMRAMKIIDLAKTMIEVFAKNKKIKIIEIGIREGEKLHEELITSEEVVRTKETKNMFIIPYHNSKVYSKLNSVKKIYSSNSETHMNKSEIKEFLKKISNSINN
jgi:UDP-N-acetylglucosamine 4,6-dehydratase/5-epimerase